METLAGPKAGDLYKYMITLSLVVMHKEGSRGIMEETEAMSPSYSEVLLPDRGGWAPKQVFPEGNESLSLPAQKSRKRRLNETEAILS